ncbi:MAG: aldehyde dehydrogenase family protein [Acidimicrobiales bacterium]
MSISMASLTRDALFIDGGWVSPKSDSSIEVINPTTEDVIATVPDASREDADRAVAAARAAFDSRSSTPREQRAEFLSRIGGAHGRENGYLAISEYLEVNSLQL